MRRPTYEDAAAEVQLLHAAHQRRGLCSAVDARRRCAPTAGAEERWELVSVVCRDADAQRLKHLQGKATLDLADVESLHSIATRLQRNTGSLPVRFCRERKCTSMVRGMSRMLFTPAHTTVMGVRLSSVRSAETSMLLSPPLCTPPMPVQQDFARLSSHTGGAQIAVPVWDSVPACHLLMSPTQSGSCCAPPVTKMGMPAR